MSTVTSILGSDIISNSRSTINTNFGNLNADKIEAATSATLSNKTINTTQNTVQINGTTVSSVIGTGKVVLQTAPSILGNMSATTADFTGTVNVGGSTGIANGQTVLAPTAAYNSETGNFVIANSGTPTKRLYMGYDTVQDITYVQGVQNGVVTKPLALQPIGNNISLFGLPSFGGGTNVLFIANASVVPSTNPSGGGILYVDSGALKYRGSSGTVSTIANA